MSRSRLSVLWPWALLFVVANLIATQPTRFPTGAANALSRFATMRAMVEQGTFRIDSYRPSHDGLDPKDWTVDWARTPDGHYYSNKAPGPMFIGLPLFWVAEKGRRLLDPGRPVPDQQLVSARVQAGLSFLTQVLPLLVLCWFMLGELRSTPPAGQYFTLIAVLFGHTASVYMACYFGHGMTMILALATALALWRRRYVLVGLFYGFALLCDYSAAMLLPGLVLALALMNGRKIDWMARVAIGAALPAALWCWYHAVCFGSPLTIANHFQNPLFLSPDALGPGVGGVFDSTFRLDVLGELLWGGSRGLLVTQPWVLVSIPFVVAALAGTAAGKTRESLRGLAVFALAGLSLLLVMNVLFGAWQGGWSAGPRYLSAGLAVFALLVGLRYEALGRVARVLLWTALAVAVLFHLQVYATHVLVPPEVSLWSWQWGKILAPETGYRSLAKFLLLLAGFAGAAWHSVRRVRADVLQDGSANGLRSFAGGPE